MASTSCQVESIEPAMSSVPTSRAQSLFKMIKMGAPNNQFHAWMDHVTCWYNGLADDEKNEVLETLISASGPHQMFVLCRKFPDLLYRDFISQLPPEVAAIVLTYLDGETLLRCCLVCKGWDNIISNLPSVWWRVAIDSGVLAPSNSNYMVNSVVPPYINESNEAIDTELMVQSSESNEAIGTELMVQSRESNEAIYTELMVQSIESNEAIGTELMVQSSESNEAKDTKLMVQNSEKDVINDDIGVIVEDNKSDDKIDCGNSKTDVTGDSIVHAQTTNSHVVVDSVVLALTSNSDVAKDSGVLAPVNQSDSVSDELFTSDSMEKTNEEDTYNVQKGIKSDSKYVRSLYCHAKNVIRGFRSGSSIKINEYFIDKGSWRVTSVKYHKGCVVTGCDDHTVQVWSVPTGQLLTSVSTHSVCCLTITDHHLYTASFNANAECWDLNTGLHSKTFCGHTSAVLAIDVSHDESFLLTGSVDRTAKLWDLSKSGHEELVKTFSDTHMDWVFQVKFLSKDSSSLLFISCDSMVCCLWRTNHRGQVMSSSHVTADSSTKFTSFYHTPDNPDQLFACQWTESVKSSVFCQYRVDYELSQIHRVKSFKIWLDCIKAHLLGAGTRFAVIMCSISRKDFHVLDIQKEKVVATIATPDFYVLTRNGSTVTLCDTTWLNGFNFESMTRETPVFAASIALNRVMLGTWADFVSCVGQTCPVTTMDSLSKTGNDSSQNQETLDPHMVEQIYELANRLLR